MTRNKDILPEFERVLRLESQALQDSIARLSQPEVRKQVESAILRLHQAIETGGKIVVTGIGKSGKIAQKIAATLSSTGSLAVFLHPTEGLHGDLGIVRPKDVVIALSYTGNTEELVRLLPSLKKLGVSIISICGKAQSTLVQQSDFWIHAEVEQEACPHNLTPTSSTTLALALGDAIAVSLMKLRGFEPKDFAQNHPGGSLGKRLNLTVGEVMHRGDSLARVSAQSSIEEVVVRSTEKKMGAVLVVDGPQLLGIITDGDLRRALKHKERFFQLKAVDIMSEKPISALESMLASDALRLMEERESQISVLPVVDLQGHWKGLVRLHDLVRTL